MQLCETPYKEDSIKRVHAKTTLCLSAAFNFNSKKQVTSNPRALSERCLQMSVFSYLIFDVFAVN